MPRTTKSRRKTSTVSLPPRAKRRSRTASSLPPLTTGASTPRMRFKASSPQSVRSTYKPWKTAKLTGPSINPIRQSPSRPKQLRDHQQTALNAVAAGLKDAERGKLIMACGTGKTFTSLKIAEQQTGKGSAYCSWCPACRCYRRPLPNGRRKVPPAPQLCRLLRQ